MFPLTLLSRLKTNRNRLQVKKVEDVVYDLSLRSLVPSTKLDEQK